MTNTVLGVVGVAVSVLSNVGQRREPLGRHVWKGSPELSLRVAQAARMRVHIDDAPTMAAATFAGTSGLRVWSPPV